MAYIKFNNEKIGEAEQKALLEICPFGAIEKDAEGNLAANAACKNCKLCIKKGPEECVEFVEDEETSVVDKSQWNGIVVYAEHEDSVINPVVFELLSKAKDLAKDIKHPVYALWIGDNLDGTEELLHFGADKVYAYTDPKLKHFSIYPYVSVFEDFINNVKPSTVLVGATNLGRSLGPRIAARFKTGMTADCTRLEMRENTDLVQIRPAFGGNIMARIITTNTRPQFCTVREKIFDAMDRKEDAQGEIVEMSLDNVLLDNPKAAEVVDVIKKEKVENIADADVLVVVGRGLKKEEDKALFHELADKMGGMLASSSALVEMGWMDPSQQIGLSGKTVKPKLLITFGVSGAVQFAAGMNSCEYIVSVNTDEKAPIFGIAHVCVVADMYEVARNMIDELNKDE